MSTDIRRPSNAETSQIDRVEQYTFEPIRGYPMLQWHGKRPFFRIPAGFCLDRPWPIPHLPRPGEPADPT